MSPMARACHTCGTIYPDHQDGSLCPACRARATQAKADRNAAKYGSPEYRRARRSLLSSGARCRTCGTSRDLTVDHIVPLAHGGTHAPSNLQVLCRKHNSQKAAR